MKEISQEASTGLGPLQAYTPKTVAEFLGCSPRHVYKLIAAGEIAAFAIGRRGLRIRAAELARWQAAKEGRTAKAASSDVEVTRQFSASTLKAMMG